ncbi:lytic polysaccharide monooxygenase [Annulohypoxylon maeteangense]|uniref:lytic polysaccharide monooxygenase n=1 Tax=Annulohypoxylon maeteangense TaxID=1927788 RepID=UPI002007DACB|nr:lytic polysaccharide monooxygenase [Annulohypoxylon maeteangense]KAI0883936.1 lytic polysaccharide monooxygenase [Annulohypoxylon maeteangense]
MKSVLILVSALAITPIHGHGGIFNYTIDGVEYAGHYPWLPEEGQVSVQRRWFPDPLYIERHPYMACNRGNPLAKTLPTLHAPIKAGGKVMAHYDTPPCPTQYPVPLPTTPSVPEWLDPPPMKCMPPGYSWPHNQGPLLDCQGPCGEWDGRGKRWFKIWEAGYIATGVPGASDEGQIKSINEGDRWWHSHLILNGVNITIPAALKPGNYLLRHEIINLRGDRIQIYPECAQLEVSGEGSAVPSEEYLVDFPGGYKATDPGIEITGKLHLPIGLSTFNYTMPGPKLWVPEE